MTKVSVIIPFYQVDEGILRRSITSVIDQTTKYKIHILAVDDGSPANLQREISGILFPPNITIEIITKKNGGVSSARNAGLDKVPNDTDYVAFLDSDDIWCNEHLTRALLALVDERDLYFSDNERPGFHTSYFQDVCPTLIEASSPDKDGIYEIEKESYIDLLLRKFPSQISTVVARWKRVQRIRFEESFKMAGEDMIYIMLIVRESCKICYSRNTDVICGSGINLYFSTMNWQSHQYIPRLIDELNLYKYIDNDSKTSDKNRSWAKAMERKTRREMTYFMLRQYIRMKKSSQFSIGNDIKFDKFFYALLPINIPIAIFNIVTNYYQKKLR